MSGSKPRTIKLYCPSVSKIVQLVASEEQRLDLGFIARAFGLDPSTLRLNGHFISRGIDLISSYVTWKSLLAFFSAKGFPTGKDDADPLIVDGKLSKVGTKRAHDPEDALNEISHASTVSQDGIGSSGKPELEDTNLLKNNNNKKMREASSGKNGDCGTSILFNDLGCKRKQLFEDLSLLKKLRIKENFADIPRKDEDLSKGISSTSLRCSPMSQNTKRVREDDVDEAILAAPHKKIR
ncbi:amino acid-ligase [Parasponia andersonii]|uniref:Amino acid-ligase n=1 Tax=Parasponia andersonii TaxID=3476 RepID=A0A2P5DC10_PARAD|nr:amino acid-ligase [Parasponia andersonii]